MSTSAALQHIAFIMDGNGRWAKARMLPRLAGHKQGIETVKKMLEAGLNKGIAYMTFYAFSSENWKRPEEEVQGLMGFVRSYFKAELAEAIKKNIRIKVIGDRSQEGKLSADIIEILNSAEEQTAHCTGITAVFAINYGGRDEIIRALQRIVQAEAKLTEGSMSQYLDTAGMPDPDLLIRTSGEQRLSNYLPWQLAYTEFAFTNTHWPAFSAEELDKIIDDFNGRERRFGGLKLA